MRSELLTILLVAAFATAAVGQTSTRNLDVTVRSVGYNAGGADTKFLVRQSQWIPILFELTLHSGTSFEGELHAESADLDGDLLTFIEKPVVLTSGSEPKRVWCYAISNGYRSGTGSNTGIPRITLHDDTGAIIAEPQLPAYEIVSNDVVLVLDIGDKPVVRLRTVQSGAAATGGELGLARPYYQHVRVGQAPALELPDRWWGIEGVNVIVWDEPDPEKVSAAQLEALCDWVKNGGQLLIGLGASWSRVQKSALAEILPFGSGDGPGGGANAKPPKTESGAAEVVTTRSLPNFFARFGEPGRDTFGAPIAVAAAEPIRGVRTVADRVPGGPPISLVVADTVGSGRVICTAASLRDLTAATAGDRFLRELLDLNPVSPELVKEEAESMMLRGASQSLFARLRERVELRQIGGLFVVAATAFVFAYIGLATFASWWWLRRHTLTYLSWTVFAAFAVVASAVSLGAVVLSHGIASRVDAVNVVDLSAGSVEARGACWFGFRTPKGPKVTMSLPGDGNYLRPLARGPGESTEYATPQRYSGIPAKAELFDAPVRATLKQFEGYWHGKLEGSIRGQLIVDRRTGRLTAGSWIKNDLQIPIAGGCLLYVDPRLPGDKLRVAGVTQDYRGRAEVPPAANVLALELPAIAAGEKAGDFASKEYERVDKEQAAWEKNQDRAPMPDLTTLFQSHQKWVGNSVSVLPFTRDLVDPAWSALLLLSTRNLYLHSRETDTKKIGIPISGDGLVDRDISHWLTRDQAVLMLFAEEPGPAVLRVDGRETRTRSGLTLYRVRIPIETRGSAAPAPVSGGTP